MANPITPQTPTQAAQTPAPDLLPDLPADPRLMNFNEFAEDVFLHKVVESNQMPLRSRNALWEPRPREWPSLVADGVLDMSDEIDMVGFVSKIISTHLEKLPTQEAQKQAALGLTQFSETFTSYMANYDRVGLAHSLDAETTASLWTTISLLEGKCSPWENEILTYFRRELEAAAPGGLTLITSPEDLFEDLIDKNDFLDFAHQKGLNLDFLAHLQGVPIDFIDCGQRQAPMVVVYLDKHQSPLSQSAQKEDFSRWQSQNAVFGLEGYNSSWDSADPQKVNIMIDATFNRIIDTLSIAANQVLNQKDLDANRLIALTDLRGQITQAWECFNQGNREGATEILEGFDLQQLPEKSRLYIAPLLLLLRQASVIGTESANQDLDDSTLPTPSLPEWNLLEELWQTDFRSKLFLDHTLDGMKKQHKTLGVLRAGYGHYLSIKEYAQKRGDVNVIFMRT